MDNFFLKTKDPAYGRVRKEGAVSYRLHFQVALYSWRKTPLFTGPRLDCLLAALRWTAEEEGVTVLKIRASECEARILFAAAPHHSVEDVVRALKRRAEAALLARFPAISEGVSGRPLFEPGYLAESVGFKTPQEVDAALGRGAQKGRVWSASPLAEPAAKTLPAGITPELIVAPEIDPDDDDPILEVDDDSIQDMLSGLEG